MDIEKVLLDEKTSLRVEMKHLKMCQLRYFMLSITIPGVVFGIGSRLSEINNILFLSPLIVIFPCWWIFIDKAKTVSRIVGYYRVLEYMLIEKGGYEYRGWENSLAEFREHQNNKEFKYINGEISRKHWKEIILLDMPHKYWVINWYTYMTVSLISIMLATINHDSIYEKLTLFAVMIVFIFTIYFTGKSLMDLIYGKNSYNSNEELWKEVLQFKNNKKANNDGRV